MRKRMKDLMIIIVLSIILTVLLYISSYTALSLSKVTEISDPSTWLAFIGGILGTALGVTGTYLLVIIDNEKKNKDSEDHVSAIISMFLTDEIVHNNNILKYDHLCQLIEIAKKRNHNTVSFGVGNNNPIRLGEFEKVKYELIKIKNERIRRVVIYYSLVSRVAIKSNTNCLTIDEVVTLLESGKELVDFT